MKVLLLALALAPFGLAENPDLSPLPPRTLVHMGQKPHMLENDRHGTIDAETWDRHIMGRDTHFGLVPWRRGLYGGASADTLELYAARYFGAARGQERVPWLMRITLKDECTKAGAVTDLATDERYLKWLFENATRVAQNYRYCLNLSTSDCRDLVTGYQTVALGREENLCDELMQELILGTGTRVVRDVAWDASWYLRDRSCIEKLEAGPNVVLDVLAGAKWDHESRNRTYSPTTPYGLGNFAILVGALKDAGKAEPAVLDRLRAALAVSDLHASYRPADGLEERALWIREAGPAAVDAYRRCASAGRGPEFRAHAQAFEERLHEKEATRYDARLLPWLRSIAPGFSALCR